MSWSPKPLSEILEQSGQHRAGSQDLPVLSITMKHGLIDQADKFKKRVASTDTSNYRIAYKDELVVGFPIDEGVLGFQTKYLAGIVSPAYDVWKVKTGVECHIPYLEGYLRSSQARALYASRMQGAVARRRSLTKADFLGLEIPFPSINDQIRIAHLLGKVEWLIAQRKQHLQQLDDLLKSVFLEMFGDPVRNEKGWEKKTAIDYADCIVPGRDKPKSFSGGTPWVTTGDLQQLAYTEKSSSGIGLSEDEIKEVRARVVPKSSVLLTCVGDLGVVSICTTDMVINQQLHAFQVSEAMTEEFFMYSLSFQRKYMYQNASQTTLPYMNKTVCNKTPMICPPKDLQIRFAKTVKIVCRIKSLFQKSLTDMEALYGALSQKAFKGELDLSRIRLPADQAQQVDLAPLPENIVTPSEVLNRVVQFAPPESRSELLARWFNRYVANTSPDASLGSRELLESAWQTLQETQLETEGETPALTLADYDALKGLLFAALEGGTLMQTFAEESNRVSLHRRPADWSSF